MTDKRVNSKCQAFIWQIDYSEIGCWFAKDQDVVRLSCATGLSQVWKCRCGFADVEAGCWCRNWSGGIFCLVMLMSAAWCCRCLLFGDVATGVAGRTGARTGLLVLLLGDAKARVAGLLQVWLAATGVVRLVVSAKRCCEETSSEIVLKAGLCIRS